VLASFFCAGAVHAHVLSPAYFGLVEMEPGRFRAQWKVSISGGLVDVLEPQIPVGCGVDGAVRTYVIEDARVQHAELVCTAPLAGRVFTVNGLELTATDVLLRVENLDGSSFTHRLVPEAPSVVIPQRAGALDVAATYLALGVEHILLGIDHLLFVLALLLLVRGIGRLIATITAFTVAHSITLAAATLGFVNVPSAPIEATIALSILFVATELARRSLGGSGFGGSGFSRDSDAIAAEAAPTLTQQVPWLVAFTFGLLHGFGFAGALSEVGLPAHAIPLALLFFNVGVELGQLAFIAVVFTGAWALRRIALEPPAWAPRLTAYVIGSVAAFWVLERTVTSI
jgi:hypothetical protein